MCAFGFRDNIDGVDTVYPKTKVTKELIEVLFIKWVSLSPATYKNNKDDNDINDDIGLHDIDEDNDNNEDNELTNGHEENNESTSLGGGGGGEVEEPKLWQLFKPKVKSYKKKGTIIDLLMDKEVVRETQILELTRTLTNIFPGLKGDIVTFIGSTFLKYGDKKPYLNHCIALGTCNDVENAKIETYNTEKKVLLAWTKLIQEEDPDVIIGYNIFGFDYQFMYLRAKELGCERNFLELSRNKREVCLNRNWRTGKEGLEENTLVIASGQHDLKFVKMTGRLQIDLYNYLRRDYQLTQYKLDYVSGYFIGDDVKKLEHNNTESVSERDNEINKQNKNQTKIYSKNLTGLENGNFVNFEEEAHSVDSYKNGQKFEVSCVNVLEGSFIIQGHEQPNMKKKVRWGLAKDDVTPQDIFRMTNEGPAERAITAKYCIQDCNLVHHLM